MAEVYLEMTKVTLTKGKISGPCGSFLLVVQQPQVSLKSDVPPPACNATSQGLNLNMQQILGQLGVANVLSHAQYLTNKGKSVYLHQQEGFRSILGGFTMYILDKTYAIALTSI